MKTKIAWYNYSYRIWKLIPTRYIVKELGGTLNGFNNINPWRIHLDDDLSNQRRPITQRHEETHSCQYLDFVPFAIKYCILSIVLGLGWFWVIFGTIALLFGSHILGALSFIINKADDRQNGWNDYRDNVLEQEAWDNSPDPTYNERRVPIWGYVKYFFKKKNSILKK